MQGPVAAAEAQSIENTAHLGGADPGQDAAAPGARRESPKSAQPHAADDRSTGSTGSWKTCLEERSGPHPATCADMPLAAAGAPSRQLSPDEVLSDALPAVARSIHPTTLAVPDSAQRMSLGKPGKAASTANRRPDRAPAEHSPSEQHSDIVQATLGQVRGPKGAKGSPFKTVASMRATEKRSRSPDGCRTTLNTRLTPDCIYGCGCGFSLLMLCSFVSG